jgi:TolB-like protein
VTHAGIVGTVDYMALEQIRGEEITPAADLYALGVVMYEMATGQRPFTGDSKVVVALKHLNDQPRPPRDFVPDLDPSWSETILACLRKPPHERFQAAAEVKAALVRNGERSRRWLWSGGSQHLSLRWTILVCAVILIITVLLWQSGVQRSARVRAALPPRSLAVLPLANLSSNTEQEYFVDGMTDQLITRLGTISALKVISRTSVMHYKDTHETVPAIAKELNVDAVVQGSVLQAGDRVRITIQFTDARTDENLWAARALAASPVSACGRAGELSLTREGGRRSLLRKDEVEIGNPG